VWTPDGKLIGRIRLPETTANLCFGGLKRNRLFMAASQSLYAFYVRTQGAAPGSPALAVRRRIFKRECHWGIFHATSPFSAIAFVGIVALV
jgi:hypothetical protein